MTHQELADAVPAYAVGALERIERQALEAHLLSGCIPCHTALKDYQSIAVVLPFDLAITAPPRALKAKIMAARTAVVATESGPQPSGKPSLEPGEWMNHLFPPSSPSKTSFGWALGLVILGVLLLLAFMTWNAPTQRTADMEQLAQLKSQAEEASSRLATIQLQLSEREESLTKTREELARRMAELAEVKDQLFQREAEVEDLKSQLPQESGRPPSMP